MTDTALMRLRNDLADPEQGEGCTHVAVRIDDLVKLLAVAELADDLLGQRLAHDVIDASRSLSKALSELNKP